MVIVAIAAIAALALLFEFHAPVWTIFLTTPIAYSATFSSLAQINLGTTWCALNTGKNAVGSVTSASRAVLGTAWAASPVLCFALYSSAPPSAAALAGMPNGAQAGRAAIPLALCAGWYVVYGCYCLYTLKTGHPVKPPNFKPALPAPVTHELAVGSH